MGNDGGSLPKRCDQVRDRTKEIKKDYISMNKSRSMLCAISNSKLKKPIVGCRMGYQYNKEVVIKNQLNKTVPRAFKHIAKTKHIRNINATENPEKGSVFPFICPLSQIEFNGLTKSVFIWSCGCMMSYKVVQNIKDGKGHCANCNKIYEKEDIISQTYTPEELEIKKRKMFHVKEILPQKNGFELIDDEIQKAVKKLKVDEMDENLKDKKKEDSDGNILDAQATPGSTNTIFKGLFHRDYQVENANDLTFRNVRFGIR